MQPNPKTGLIKFKKSFQFLSKSFSFKNYHHYHFMLERGSVHYDSINSLVVCIIHLVGNMNEYELDKTFTTLKLIRKIVFLIKKKNKFIFEFRYSDGIRHPSICHQCLMVNVDGIKSCRLVKFSRALVMQFM